MLAEIAALADGPGAARDVTARVAATVAAGHGPPRPRRGPHRRGAGRRDGQRQVVDVQRAGRAGARRDRRPSPDDVDHAGRGVHDRLDVRADAAGLLSWLGVHQHVVVDDPPSTASCCSTCPDHDSTAAAHREEVDRLVQVVDVFVWVVDPQKYADAALHHDYLRRFAGHADVTMVVLNQIDTLAPRAPGGRRSTTWRRILAADGMAVARAGVVAKVTGQGRRGAGHGRVGAHRRGHRRAAPRARRPGERAAGARRPHRRRHRLDRRRSRPRRSATVAPRAVTDRAAGELDGRSPAPPASTACRRRGATPTADGVRTPPGGRRRAGSPASGPIRCAVSVSTGVGPGDRRGRATITRSPSPGRPCRRRRRWRRPPCRRRSGGSSTTCRADLPEPWRHRLGDGRRRAGATTSTTPSTGPSGTARLPTDRPRWWRVAGAVQWLLAAALVVGLLWLLAIFVVAWFNLPDLPTADVGELPLPTVLAIGGALLGLLLAAIARWATGSGRAAGRDRPPPARSRRPPTSAATS